jgi:hypothetical protein
MKHSTRYDGKNPIPDGNRGKARATAEAATDAMPTPAETARAAAEAAVAISRIDAAGAPDADPNVTVKHVI